MDEASLFLVNSPPYNFSLDPISYHPLNDFASISFLTDRLHQYSYCSIISYQNKHTKIPNKHALPQPSLNSTYMLPAISFNFSALLHGKTYFKSCLKGNKLLPPHFLTLCPHSNRVLLLTTPLWFLPNSYFQHWPLLGILCLHIRTTTFRPPLHGYQSDISNLTWLKQNPISCQAVLLFVFPKVVDGISTT